jgi:hypothetical protein
MADNPRWLYAYPTVEFLGGSRTRDVMAVGYATTPHGVPFEVRLRKPDYLAGDALAAALAPQTIIETLFQFEPVADVDWSTVSSPRGALRDEVTIYVTSTSGESQDTLSVPVTELGPKLHEPQINALRAQLDKQEGA